MSPKALVLQELYLYLCLISAIALVLLPEELQLVCLLGACLYLPERWSRSLYLLLVVLLLAVGIVPAERQVYLDQKQSLHGSIIEGILLEDGVFVGPGKQLLRITVRSIRYPTQLVLNTGSFGVLEVKTDCQRWLYRSQRVECEVYGDTASSVRLLGVQKARGRPEQLRAYLLDTLFGRLGILDPESEAFVGRLLLGHRKDPSLPVGLLLERCGAAHLSALSGLHLMIISSYVLLLLYPLGKGRLSSLFLLSILLGYYLLVGSRPSLFRALCMSCSALLYSILGKQRPIEGVRLLCFSLALYRGMTAEPVGMGLVLSYCATVSILRDALPLSRCLPAGIPAAVRMAVSVAITCLCWTACLLAAYTSKVYLVSPISSLLITPLVTLLMYLAMTLLLVPFQLTLIPELIRILRETIELIAAALTTFPVLSVDSFDLPVALIILLQVTIRMLLGCGMIVLRTRKGEDRWKASSSTIPR